MKSAIFFAGLMVTTAAFAAPKKQGYLIESEFSFSAPGREIKSQSSFVLSKDNKSWTSLVEPKNGVALLGRLVKAEKNSVHMEYLVVDTTQPHAVISAPGIVSLLGEKAEVSIGNEGEKIKLSLLAKKTEYTQEK